mgnify:CR=1 FL=1
MITPDEYTVLLQQNANKNDKIARFAQQNLGKFINYIDGTLKDRAEKLINRPLSI